MAIILTSCCFCVPLKSGALVIGIISLVGSLICVFGSVAALSGWDTLEKELSKLGPLNQDGMEVLYYIVVVILVVTLLHSILCSLLIHGIRIDSPKLMFPFLLMNMVALVLGVFFLIFLSSRGEYTAAEILWCWLSLILSCYFLFVIYSHYRELRETQQASYSSVDKC